MPMGSKEAKASGHSAQPVIFRTYSLGVSTNRDSVVYGFDEERLAKRVEQFVDDYNAELDRWRKKAKPPGEPGQLAQYVDDFVSYDRIKWSRDLKLKFLRDNSLVFSRTAIRQSLYRPFTKQLLYCQKGVVDRTGPADEFPHVSTAKKHNVAIVVNLSPERPFCCLTCDIIPSKDVAGGFGSPGYCFPLYTYSPDGKEREDNISITALWQFQKHYRDKTITREDIFYYVYAMLHHPQYRARFAENLKRELPRVPSVTKGADFHSFAEAGRELADLHVNYEKQKAYPLKRRENPEARLDWRVEAMKLTKDRAAIAYNDFLALDGIPAEAFDYKLGNRSALEWVIDQYRVSRDEHGDITNDPNRDDDEQYIVRLIGQVITVSLETQRIIADFPPLNFQVG
jgi:predicted helicase